MTPYLAAHYLHHNVPFLHMIKVGDFWLVGNTLTYEQHYYTDDEIMEFAWKRGYDYSPEDVKLLTGK